MDVFSALFKEPIFLAVYAILSYLLGSIHFCRILGIAIKHVDIVEKSPDHNPGAANAFWYCGKSIGIMGLILDWLKGFIPVFFAIQFVEIGSPYIIILMLAPVLGHAFSIFNAFRGGKCITTIIGILCAFLFSGINYFLAPIFGFLDIFFSYIKKILPGNLRAVIIFSIFIVSAVPACIYLEQYMLLVGSILISFVAIFKHLPIYTPEEKLLKRRLRNNKTK